MFALGLFHSVLQVHRSVVDIYNILLILNSYNVVLDGFTTILDAEIQVHDYLYKVFTGFWVRGIFWFRSVSMPQRDFPLDSLWFLVEVGLPVSDGGGSGMISLAKSSGLMGLRSGLPVTGPEIGSMKKGSFFR